MRNRPLMISLMIAGALGAFALGVVSAPHLGALFGRNARPPAVTVSLDLMGEVRTLRGETRRLKAALAENAGRVEALAAREAELAAARQRIAALTDRTAELELAAQQTADLSEKVEGLRQARDRARKVSAELEQHRSDLRAALQTNAAMKAKMEGLRRARDEAGETSAAHARTIAELRREIAAMGEKNETRQQSLNAEISSLRETVEAKEREIARLRRTLEEAAATPPAAAASPPAATPEETTVAPAVSLPVDGAGPESAALNGAAHEGGTGVLDGAAAYRAGDYVRAYQIWRPLAEAGNARAQFHLGALYYEGRGVAKNLKSARLWLERAASNGSDPAGELLARIGP